MSMSVNSFSTINSRKGISGLMSGLNTDEIVEQMTSGTRQRITTQLQNRQLAMWKQEQYREITSKLTTFNTKYFSYTNTSNNIMSSKFFQVAKANTTSPYVKVSGDASVAKNVIIKDIEQLAKKAGFTSNHIVSDQKITSGTVRDKWVDNTIGGSSMTVSYQGKTQTLRIKSDFYLDSNHSDGQNLNKVLDELNNQISKNSDLRGKLKFELDGSGKVSLVQTAAAADQTNDLRIESGSVNLLDGLGLDASPTKAYDEPAIGYSQITATDSARVDSFFEYSENLGTAGMNLEIDGKAYALNLRSDFRFDNAGGDKAQKVVNALNEQIQADKELKDKIAFQYVGGKVTLVSTDGTDHEMRLNSGNTNLLDGLGLDISRPKYADEDKAPTFTSIGGTDVVNGDSFVKMSEYLGGNGMSLKFGDSTYNLQLPGNFRLDNAAGADNIQKVLNALNDQISANADLNGKLKFVKSGSRIALEQLDADKKDLSITAGSGPLMAGLGLYTTDTADASGTITGTDSTRVNGFSEYNRFAGGSIDLEINGSKEKLALPADFRFSNAALAQNPDGTYTAAALNLQNTELKQAFEKAINDNANLKDVLEVDTAGGALSFKAKTASGGVGSMKILGSTDAFFLENIGLEITETASETITGTAYDVAKLLDPHAQDAPAQREKNLSDVLSGSTLTLDFNGIQKTIQFKESEKDQYADADGLKDYIQKAIDKAYGDGRVTVSVDANDQLSFQTSDPSFIFSVQSSSKSGVLGENGALHILSGESNRVEYTKTLRQLQDQFSLPLTSNSTNGKYEFTINGVEFSFDEDTMLGDIITKINSNKEAGVTVSYSSVTDKFSVTANDNGASGKVDIADTGTSNLMQVLFGTKDDPDGYTVEAGQDLKLNVSFDGGKTYTDLVRSDNTFSVDGVSFEILGKADDIPEEKDEFGNVTKPAEQVKENISFTVDSNIDELVKKLSDFVKDYNEIATMINGKTTEKRYGRENAEDTDSYPPLTDEQKKEMSEKEIEQWEEKAKMGLLRNDQTLNTIMLDMRRAMSDPVKGTTDALHQIGISTAAYAWDDGGQLNVDEETLKKAILEDPAKIVQMFTKAETGISARMKASLDKAVSTSGEGGLLIQLAGRANSIAPDQSYLSRQISDMTTQLKTLKTRLKTEEDRYYAQFTRLETYLSKMNAQSEWLASQSGGGQ